MKLGVQIFVTGICIRVDEIILPLKVMRLCDLTD